MHATKIPIVALHHNDSFRFHVLQLSASYNLIHTNFYFSIGLREGHVRTNSRFRDAGIYFFRRKLCRAHKNGGLQM